MKRSVPLTRGRPLKAGKPLRRRTRLRRRNPERAARRRERQFGPTGYVAWLLSHPCITCGDPATDPSHAARSRGAGGTWKEMVPQCRRCHQELHDKGASAFPWVDFAAQARTFVARWSAR